MDQAARMVPQTPESCEDLGIVYALHPIAQNTDKTGIDLLKYSFIKILFLMLVCINFDIRD
jgi:hypothetical protein